MIKYAVTAFAAVFLLILVAVAVLLVVVLSGPTELGFLKNRIISTLTAALGEGYEASVGRAVLNVDPVYGLVLEVDNIAVRDSRGAIVANVPSTRLDIDPAALLALDFRVPAVELNKAEISIARAENGEIFLGDSLTARDALRRPQSLEHRSSADVDFGFPKIAAVFQMLDSGIEPVVESAISAGLHRFSINSSTIEMWDAKRAQRRRFPRADLAIVVDPVTTAMRANLATIGQGGRWTAEFERDIDASSGARTLSAVFSQLTLADILPNLGKGKGRVTADIPLYGRAVVRYDSEGAVTDAAARLDFGAGILRFSEGREAVLLDEATVKLRWDIEEDAIVVQPSTFFSGETRGVVAGKIVPHGDPAIGRYQFKLESRGAVLSLRDTAAPPLMAQRVELSGIADLPSKLISFDEAIIQTPEGSIAAAGSLGFEGPTPSLALAASFSAMPAWAAKQLWVPFLAPGARRWVVNHVTDGRIVSGTLEAAIPGGVLWTGGPLQLSKEMLRLDVRFEDIAFSTIGDLPPIEGASGVAVLAGSTFGVDLDAGMVRVPSGKTVNIDSGLFAIADTAQRYPEGAIEMRLSGDAGPLSEIGDAEPFKALSKQNVAPSDVTGVATASVSVRTPLREDVTEADVDWRVSIDGVGLACAAPLVGYIVTEANVNILVTPVEITVRGKAKIDGVAADVDMHHPIADGYLAGDSGQQMVRLVLDDAARKRLGIGLDEVLAGSVATYVSNIENGSGQHYDLDLKRARLVLPGLGWSKGIGVPASLSFDLIPIDVGYAVKNLVLEGADFGFSGSATLDSDYGIASADIERFYLRASDSLSFKLRRSKTGYAISASGKSFDFRGFLKSIREAAGSSGTPDLLLDAKVDRLIGYAEEEIRAAEVSLVSASGVTRKLDFTGKIGDGEIVATYADNGNAATMSVQSPEAGRVLRFADLYSRVGQGYLRVSGSRAGVTGPLVGVVELTNFAIVGEPAMKNIVSKTSPHPDGGRSGNDPNNVRFDRLVINFAKSDAAITVREGLLGGGAIGATFNGRFDLTSSTVSINGTYLPAYQVNNLFGRLPIIGFALGGNPAEGLIGVTFKVQGSIDEPQVFINPLSAVAPGIFRKIFEFQ